MCKIEDKKTALVLVFVRLLTRKILGRDLERKEIVLCALYYYIVAYYYEGMDLRLYYSSNTNYYNY